MRATELVVPVQPPLGATLMQPQGSRVAALVIQGSGTHDRDGNMQAAGFKSTLYRRVARELAQRCAITTLRFDKRGHDKPAGYAHDYTVAQRLADAAAALALLRKHSPGLALVVIGHSEGALVAAKLAETEDVAGVASLAAPFGNLFELYKSRAQRRHALAPTDKTARAIDFAAKLEAHFKEGGRMLPEEFAAFAKPYLGAGYEGWESYDWLAGHWAEALKADPRKPMLVVQGGRDARLWPDNAQRWQKWCLAREAAEFALIEHMGHDLNDARQKAFRVDEDVLRLVCDWFARVTSPRAPTSSA